MARRLLVIAAALTAACVSARGGTAPSPAPGATPTPASPVSEAPAAAGAATPAPFRSDVIRYGPNAMRYVVHRRLHIQQALGGQEQGQDLGARIYVAATIAGPADSVGYPATFTVDSVVPDSGTPAQVAATVSRARRLVFSGRLTARGEFVNAVASDSALAQSVVQLLAGFRDFLPRVPAEGLTPGAAWTDTLETTQKGAGAEVSRRAIVRATAGGWSDYAGTRSLRLEASSTYQVAGTGTNAGQPFELSGSGSATTVSFIAADGRYLGGESRDSTTLTVRLPVQGVAIPVIQVTRTTVAVQP
jgi:hypothetical protein